MANQFLGRIILRGGLKLNSGAVPTVSFVDSTSNESAGEFTSFEFLKPTLVQEGDIMVGIIHWGNSSGSGQGTRVYPEGFTEVFAASDPASDVRRNNTLISWKLATNTEPDNYTVSWDLAGGVTMDILAFRGVDQSTPFETSVTIRQNGYSTGDYTMSEIITENDNCMMIFALTNSAPSDGNGQVTAYPVNMIQHTKNHNSSPAQNGDYWAWNGYEFLDEPGPTGDRTWTLSTQSSGPTAAAIMCALKPAPA